jgi:hypothetical protein
MIYKLVHGISATHIIDWFNVGASTIRKYVDTMCDVLCDKKNCLISVLLFHLEKTHPRMVPLRTTLRNG